MRTTYIHTYFVFYIYRYIYFPYKTKVAKGDPYINSDCDGIFWVTICHQKATLQAIPEYLSEFRVFR